jgi:mono/diheme cytochrome c family protein
MRTWLTLVAAALAAFAAGAVLLTLGIYDIAATDQHTRPVYWLLDRGMRQSIRFHARNIVAPPLTDPARARLGRVLYDANCVRCHGAPGVAPESFALGMTPSPANLAYASREWPPAQLFWAIRHGMKMTGMPAWEFRLDDDELWAIVAYLQVMPRESPQQYRASGSDRVQAPPRAVVEPAWQPSTLGNANRGIVALRQYGCATCHRIPGVVGADTPVGPPLAHIATRSFIAGVVANNPGNLVRWLRTPQTLHPGGAMPDLGVTESDARDIAAYLYTLQ